MPNHGCLSGNERDKRSQKKAIGPSFGYKYISSCYKKANRTKTFQMNDVRDFDEHFYMFLDFLNSKIVIRIYFTGDIFLYSTPIFQLLMYIVVYCLGLGFQKTSQPLTMIGKIVLPKKEVNKTIE